MTSDQMVAKASDTPSDLTCNQLIVAASMVKDLKHKEKIYVNAVQTYPDCCGLYCNAGAVAIEQGNTKHAKKMLQQALQINDLLAEAYNNLGIVAVMEIITMQLLRISIKLSHSDSIQTTIWELYISTKETMDKQYN